MAIDFNGTNSYLEIRLVNNLAGAISMSCWFSRDVLGVTSGIISVANTSIDRNLHMILTSTDYLQAQSRNGDLKSATSTATISQNTWHHGLAVYPSASSRSVYLDGGNKGTDATASTLQDGAHLVYAGGKRSTGRSLYFNGQIAEHAVWNAELSDEDAMSLAQGMKPYLIKPQSLIYYNPMIRNNIDLFQTEGISGGFVSNNISVVAHTRRYG